MNFSIFIKNVETGLEKEFENMQQIADFLATELNPKHWFGHQNLGPLPAPTVVAVADAPEVVAESGQPSLDAALPVVSDVIAEAVAPDTNLVATPEQIAAADALPQAPAPTEAVIYPDQVNMEPLAVVSEPMPLIILAADQEHA